MAGCATSEIGPTPTSRNIREGMARNAGYKRPGAIITRSTLCTCEPDCHMPQFFNPRKRRNPEELSRPPDQTSQHDSKRTKRNHHNKLQSPTAFWDNLSRIHLTKDALKELDRRNTQVAPIYHPTSPSLLRPITRGALDKLKKGGLPTRSATDFLSHCRKRSLKEIKQFARAGGPDLSDARGVCSNPAFYP